MYNAPAIVLDFIGNKIEITTEDAVGPGFILPGLPAIPGNISAEDGR